MTPPLPPAERSRFCGEPRRSTTMNRRLKRILFIANGHSVHAQEWLRLLEGTGWDVHAFVGGAVPPCRIDATFHTLDTKAPNPAANRVKPFWPMRRGVARVCRLRFGNGPDAESRRLAALIRRLRPAVVHSLRLQDEGYTALGAVDAIRDVGAAWVVSLWGSDLAWFGELPGHRDRIRSVMAACDCVLADCRRDLELSRRFGAAEHQIGLPEAIPGNGGLDPATIRGRIQIADPVQRRVILFPHARDDRFHRFTPVLAALRDARAALRGLMLVFLGADEASRRAIACLSPELLCRCIVCDHRPREEVFDWLARSRAVVKPSLSDGTPNVMLEAMAAGALPVLSPIASIREWIDDGINGLLVANDDVPGLARAVARACLDDALLPQAAVQNAAIVAARADRRLVRGKALDLYERLLRGGGRVPGFGDESESPARAARRPRRAEAVIAEAESCVSS